MSEQQGEPGTATVARIPIPDEGVELLFGSYDTNLKMFEDLFGVRIRTDGNMLLAEGDDDAVARVQRVVQQ
ncbi:MAG: hypothetical protein QGG89_11580, partial [Vicinamibacterales bacterium]|nr:hypothetical protein [Vicinamibacterales bacterium]